MPFGLLGNARTSKQCGNSHSIGLSVCKQICEALGGEIDVQSTVGKGSTFTFKIQVHEVYETNQGRQKKKMKEKTQHILLDQINEEIEEVHEEGSSDNIDDSHTSS